MTVEIKQTIRAKRGEVHLLARKIKKPDKENQKTTKTFRGCFISTTCRMISPSQAVQDAAGEETAEGRSEISSALI